MDNNKDRGNDMRISQNLLATIQKIGVLRFIFFIVLAATAIFFLHGYLTDPDPIRQAKRICKRDELQQNWRVEDVFGEDVTHVCVLSRGEYFNFRPFDITGDEKPNYVPPGMFSNMDYYVLYSEYGSGRKNVEYLLIHEQASKSGKNYTSFGPGYTLKGTKPCWGKADELKLICGNNQTVTAYFQSGE